MTTRMRLRDLRRMALLPLVACALALGGCESEDTDTDISPTRFSLDRELLNYSDTDEFAWDTTLGQALVVVKIDDFTEGDTSLRVYDGKGVLVLAAALNTTDYVYFNGNDLYFQKQTAKGAPGQWKIVVGYNDFTGDIKITME